MWKGKMETYITFVLELFLLWQIDFSSAKSSDICTFKQGVNDQGLLRNRRENCTSFLRLKNCTEYRILKNQGGGGLKRFSRCIILAYVNCSLDAASSRPDIFRCRWSRFEDGVPSVLPESVCSRLVLSKTRTKLDCQLPSLVSCLRSSVERRKYGTTGITSCLIECHWQRQIRGGCVLKYRKVHSLCRDREVLSRGCRIKPVDLLCWRASSGESSPRGTCLIYCYTSGKTDRIDYSWTIQIELEAWIKDTDGLHLIIAVDRREEKRRRNGSFNGKQSIFQLLRCCNIPLSTQFQLPRLRKREYPQSPLVSSSAKSEYRQYSLLSNSRNSEFRQNPLASSSGSSDFRQSSLVSSSENSEYIQNPRASSSRSSEHPPSPLLSRLRVRSSTFTDVWSEGSGEVGSGGWIYGTSDEEWDRSEGSGSGSSPDDWNWWDEEGTTDNWTLHVSNESTPKKSKSASTTGSGVENEVESDQRQVSNDQWTNHVEDTTVRDEVHKSAHSFNVSTSSACSMFQGSSLLLNLLYTYVEFLR